MAPARPSGRRAKKRRRHGVVPPADGARAALPVNAHASDIAHALAAHDVLVLVAETGSGKTTQVPQQFVDADPCARVVCTQPRRVAAISVAARVAAERGTELGKDVGYAVRFDDRSTPCTRIRYVTDGVLLRELLSAESFGSYTHVVVDEVHERSVNTDLVLGAARKALVQTPRVIVPGTGTSTSTSNTTGSGTGKRAFKLVVMSATTDAEKLAAFFKDASLSVATVTVPGRSHRVDVLYASDPVGDYVDAAVTAAFQIHVDYPFPGDVLVFLPGQEEILAGAALLRERIAEYLPEKNHQDLRIHTLYASLPPAEQLAAITPLPPDVFARKVVFATNVAETSITIPGVRYVVDCGVAKVRNILPTPGIHADVLRVSPISQAQAAQRCGRAGRITDGIVFRLYTPDTFNQLAQFPPPEILRIDPAPALLQVAALGARESASSDALKKFPFVDRPGKRAMARALETLVVLGALDDEMKLTETGSLMASLPVPPQMARALLESLRLGCVDHMVAAAAMLSVEGGVFVSPKSKRDQARAAHKRFLSARGDMLSLVRVLDAYVAVEGRNKRTEFCKSHFLNHRALEAANNVRNQLTDMLATPLMRKWAANSPPPAEIEDAQPEELLLRALTAGFFKNVARRKDDGKYALAGAEGKGRALAVEVHPASCLRGKNIKWLLFHEMVVTSKPYLRNCAAIKLDWVWQHSNGYFAKKVTDV